MRIPIRTFRRSDVSRLPVAVVVTILAVTGFGCCRWFCKSTPCPEPVERHLFIRPAGTECEIVDGGNHTAVEVKRGEWVVWTNQMGRDVKLEFPTNVVLFGVQTAIANSQGAPLKLRLREDAQQGEWRYSPVGIGTGLPGPAIIVPPPPGG